MARARGSASPAKRFKFVCLGCSVLGFEGGICVCRWCGADVQRMKQIERLILRKFPGLSHLTTPEIFLRLWVDRLRRGSGSAAKAVAPELHEAFELQKKIERARGREPVKGTAA